LIVSLPEWYHPKYHDQSLGWHGPPINPYTGKNITYTGSKSIDDFVNELQVPQLRELVNYNPDILWCDIGGIHNSSVWQADYFNRALQQGRSVAVNDRCGDGSASDFTTIEYQAVSNTPTRFWEATRGMDPYSFGFNRETKPEDYANTNDLIENLVDAVSRGGNFLLNIGPEASGEVPEPMVKRLLEIGQWLDLVGAGIFDSTPYWITSNERNLRFTASQNGDSVYVFSFPLNSTDKHSTHHQIVIQTPLPVKKGARISLMNRSEIKVSWRYDTKGHLLLEFDLLESNQVLVFEIST
jgi:alpha-L-fucosidase